jgi:pimeloyl-ACP methyl ester carboxylesterase
MHPVTPTPTSTRRSLLPLVLISLFAVLPGAADTEPSRQRQAPPPPSDSLAAKVVGFAPIGDVQMYYEVQGSGDPILFIHGGGGSVQASWPREYATELSRHFMVIMADSRGHGHSTEGAGPITFNRLAADTVRLLDHLGLARAHVVGHSAGAVAALHLLVDFPDRVKTATLLAGLYHVDNYRPEAYKEMTSDLERLIGGERFEHRLSSRPMSVLRKLHTAWGTGPYFTLRVLDTITRPTLIVTAGKDHFFAPTVGEAMHAHIKGSELITYPEATHRVQVTNGEALIPAIRDFIGRRGAE